MTKFQQFCRLAVNMCDDDTYDREQAANAIADAFRSVYGDNLIKDAKRALADHETMPYTDEFENGYHAMAVDVCKAFDLTV